MAGIFTRPKLNEILSDENLSVDERIDRIMAMRGRDIDESYVTKSAAKDAADDAVNKAKAEWEKSIEKPDVKGSEEYKALEGRFEAYRTMQAARQSDTYKDVKPKFFETVYGMVDRAEGSKAEADQLADIKGQFEEYFLTPAGDGKSEGSGAKPENKNTPQFSQEQGRTGTNPTSPEDALFKQLSENWK